VLRLTPVSWFVLILLSFSLSPFSSDLLRYQRLSGNRYCLARMRDKSHRCHQCYISRKVNNEDSEREVRTNFLQIFTCYLHLLLTHNLLVDQFIVRSMTLSRLGYHVPKRYRARSHLDFLITIKRTRCIISALTQPLLLGPRSRYISYSKMLSCLIGACPGSIVNAVGADR